MGIKDRIVGIDAVRGIAILGMFAAHVRPRTPAGESEWGWTWVFDGRSAATFAVLVGVSMTLLARGHSPAHSHARIATRAVLLIVLGLSLQQLQTPIVCILVNTGLMMLVGMWALRTGTRVLVGMAAAFAVVGPFVRVWLVKVMSHEELICPEGFACHKDEGGWFGYEWMGPRPYPTIVSALWGFYPLVVWMAYVFVGILIGRMALRSFRALAVLGAFGVALAVAGYGGSALVGGEQRGFLDAESGWWRSASPHTYTPFEVTGNMGVTLVLIALCCAIAVAARWVLVPLAAVGAMALTAYAGHIVAVWWLRNEPVFSAHVATLVWFWVVAIVVCTAWKYALGRGPLEFLLHWTSMRAAGPDGERTAPSTTTT
ncbi:MAG: DUF1624 domain-containing protein [Demequinaceae bacterium]|nr:DUF1624 domain-containing protein [Demequinaceae bacterium]